MSNSEEKEGKYNERIYLLKEEISTTMDRIENMPRELASTQEQLATLEIEIEARKKELTRLENIQKRLTKTLQYKDEFVSVLAHELRNPLTPIIHSVEILRLERNNDKKLMDILDVIERQAKNISIILKNLLDTSRAAHGKISLNMQPVDIKDILEHAIGTVKNLLEESGHTLTVAWLPSPISIMGDPLRLEQIFVNLLSNCIKYTERDGEITINVFQENDDVVITIKDNGMGITPEVLPYIFELFAQANQELAGRKGGLGVGLMLARALAELHGGTLIAASEGKNKGSLFTVKLPIIGSHLHEEIKNTDDQKVVTVKEANPLPRKRVLIIDDNEKLIETFEKLLHALNQHVRAANNAETALSIAKEYLPEIVFMDISMPDMEGFELVKKLKKIPELSQTYFVALTGLGDKKIVQKCLNAGFNQHLLKPIGSETIRDVLHRET
jgi:two-component system CheB/CheR fusion protein